MIHTYSGCENEVKANLDIQPEKEKVRALISIFGRETPVELEFYQIEKV